MKRLGTDGISVTRDEACELMIHHLRLATLLFEAAPDDVAIIAQKMDLMAKAEGEKPTWLTPAKQWLTSIAAIYEAMEKMTHITPPLPLRTALAAFDAKQALLAAAPGVTVTYTDIQHRKAEPTIILSASGNFQKD